MPGLFIQVTYGAEAAYNDLRRYFAEGDYNADYLRTFETYLSPLLKEGFLVNHPKYKEITAQYPLPDEDADNQYIPAKGFLLYMRMYERIMRECHIVGGWDEPALAEEAVSDERVVDPMEDYYRRKS